MEQFVIDMRQEREDLEAQLDHVHAQMAAQIAASRALMWQSREQVAASRIAMTEARALLARLADVSARVHWVRPSVALLPKLPKRS